MKYSPTLYLVCYEPADNLSIYWKLKSLNLNLVVVQIDSIAFNTMDLDVDYNYYLARRGFTISQFDLSIIAAHKNIWRQLMKDSHIGLIIDQYINYNDIVSLLMNGTTSEQICDVHFLYDGESLEHSQLYYRDIRLYQWGPPYYWITPKGAQKLLKVSTARQPLDEEILAQTVWGLEVSCDDSRNIRFSENIQLGHQRLEQIRLAIFESSAWSEPNLLLLRKNLRILSDLCLPLGCIPMLFFGTLLGYVRHRDLMAWDDDVDLALEECKVDTFLNALVQDGRLSYGVYTYPRGQFTYFKIWSVDGDEIPGCEHRFPFIDVWSYRVENELAVFCDGLSEFSIKDMHPTTEVEFLSAPLMIPKNPMGILDTRYANWRRQIQVFHWSHRIEGSGFFPLSLNISTNENGLMV
ncbi:LicD family protein [Dyadobacter koreensis]|uniref:LicD family protein n=1 Tax=Dyadobacter koreensis TaxID=408657 RepID=A0A1H7AX51_9BACT|nr:LicD family protein [Dyadobacter koreensis]SEJ69838.1 LicD family protein [Dyadobacter koreensis]